MIPPLFTNHHIWCTLIHNDYFYLIITLFTTGPLNHVGHFNHVGS